MKGRYHIIVQNKRIRYEFEIKRNITILRGDSATGKTTLYDMVALASRNHGSSGIEIHCEKKCRTLEAPDWKFLLPSLHDYIIFIDEGSTFIKSTTFASMAKKSDNYFVIITREDLPNLPYSVNEIYGIHSSGKYHNTKRIYNEFYEIYSAESILGKMKSGQTEPIKFKPDKIIVEDSNSGYEFFLHVCQKAGITCQSSGGKSKIKDLLDKSDQNHILIIADGASIGPEINELFLFMQSHPNTKCYLPESFEWLILKSGLIDGNAVSNILDHPQDFIESQEYFSWERFFTAVLVKYTQNTYLSYSKYQLNNSYLHDRPKKAILDIIEGISLK
ncbi:MAG: translation initiation factor 2 [Eubacterium sp.]|nr:translation initiation factor 2 [Eubacterium sp.]MCI8918868.1 translation initiation factor 2 [Eubacterium sp.]